MANEQTEPKQNDPKVPRGIIFDTDCSVTGSGPWQVTATATLHWNHLIEDVISVEAYAEKEMMGGVWIPVAPISMIQTSGSPGSGVWEGVTLCNQLPERVRFVATFGYNKGENCPL